MRAARSPEPADDGAWASTGLIGQNAPRIASQPAASASLRPEIEFILPLHTDASPGSAGRRNLQSFWSGLVPIGGTDPWGGLSDRASCNAGAEVDGDLVFLAVAPWMPESGSALSVRT